MDAIPKQKDLLLRLLSAAELRTRVITANIANQNTPGYIRKEVHFEDLLRDAVGRGNRKAAIEHLAPKLVEDTVSPSRPDGNNVNLELELNALRENRILFETYAALLEGRGNLKRLAVTGGR